MPHISKKRLDPKKEKLLNELLAHVFTKLSTSKAEKIIDTLLTETEKKMVSKRLGAVYFLEKGVDASNVSTALNLTHQTVSRIKMQLQLLPSSGVKLIVEKASSWAKLNSLKEVLKSFLDTPRDKFLRVKKSDSGPSS